MYKVLVKVAPSPIEGHGVFTETDIAEGTIVWIFKENHDLTMIIEEYEALPQAKKDQIDKTGYLSPWTNRWVFPPQDDPAQYTNHSKANNLSVMYDENISVEPYFVANKNIAKGEELTNNYHEFDQITRETQPKWAK